MKRIVTFYIVLIAVSLYSCKNGRRTNNTYRETDFLENVKLEEHRMPTKEALKIQNLFVQDSFLIINNSRKDSIFMVFDLNTFKCIRSWGINGNGPDEYGVLTHLMKISQKKFNVADFTRFRLETYSLPEFKLENERKILNDRNESQTMEVPQTVVTTDGDLFFYDNFIGKELLISKWENGNQPIIINRFDSFKKLYESPLSYWGSLTINSKLNRLVYAYRYMRRFDILNLQGEVLKTVEITPAVHPIEHNKNLDGENSVMCYMGARASNDSFFLYYIGYSGKEITNKKMQIPCYLEEFDWNGNPLKRYELNRCITDFDIIQNKMGLISFIGIDESDEHPLIVFKKRT